MAESTIITGQFVHITQSPASIGERLIAIAIDYTIIIIYLFSTITLIQRMYLPGDFQAIIYIFIINLPTLFYFFLCETFNHGQSLGKRLMNIRVVKVDGSIPGISSYLLRWLLLPIDGLLTGGLGLLSILLTKNNQRIGDLAAGTMVIKEKNYRKIHVSLDEFDYLTKDYHPIYPQAADLTLEQINVITRTLETNHREQKQRIASLAKKIQEMLSVVSRNQTDKDFLQTILRDYQYMH